MKRPAPIGRSHAREGSYPRQSAGAPPPHPLIPADAGIQTLPNCMGVNGAKDWVPASAGTSGRRDLVLHQFQNQLYWPAASDMAAAWIASGVRRPSEVRTMAGRVLRRVKSQ